VTIPKWFSVLKHIPDVLQHVTVRRKNGDMMNVGFYCTTLGDKLTEDCCWYIQGPRHPMFIPMEVSDYWSPNFFNLEDNQ